MRLVASSTNICKCSANTLVLSAIAALTHLGGTLVQSLKTSNGSDLANISWGYQNRFATWVHDLDIHPRLISPQYTPLVYIVYKYALKHKQKSRAQARRLHSLKNIRYMPWSAPLVMYKRCLIYIANGILPLHILRSRPNISKCTLKCKFILTERYCDIAT